VTAAVGALAALASCSAFGTNGESPPDAAADGAVESEAAADASADAGDAAPVDPCSGADGSKEYAGLYVIGGESNPGAVETGAILRAPLHCDGTLGTWVTIAATIPAASTAQRPIVAALGDTLVYFGGQHNAGGAISNDTILAARRDPSTFLTAFTSIGNDATARRWRAQSASDGLAIVVAGGKSIGPDAGALDDTHVFTLSLAGELVDAPGPNLPARRSWGCAALGGGHAVVFGGEIAAADIYQADLTAPSTLSTWIVGGKVAEFDCEAIAAGGAYYLIGGDNSPARFDRYELGAAGLTVTPTLIPSALAPKSGGVRAVVSRDTLYLVGGGLGTTTLFAKLGGPTVTFALGSALPVARVDHALVVF
jgi:hypothetical protein